MEDRIRYEEPALLELDALLVRGGDKEYDDVSVEKFESSYDEEDHESVELD